MVFKDGFFHGDPHPGNIFVIPDGRIALVDFGIMGRVTEENMKYFSDTIIAIVERDFEKLVRSVCEYRISYRTRRLILKNCGSS